MHELSNGTAELKIWKPTSQGQRGRITVSTYNLWKGKPFKPLVESLRKTGGRNASGRISVWHKGGGHKRSYRRIDFVRPAGVQSEIERIEYDPSRSARIALVKHLGEEWEGVASLNVQLNGALLCVLVKLQSFWTNQRSG
jgi:ribosomal protein L2